VKRSDPIDSGLKDERRKYIVQRLNALYLVSDTLFPRMLFMSSLVWETVMGKSSQGVKSGDLWIWGMSFWKNSREESCPLTTLRE
jgi:hypothetical protein